MVSQTFRKAFEQGNGQRGNLLCISLVRYNSQSDRQTEGPSGTHVVRAPATQADGELVSFASIRSDVKTDRRTANHPFSQMHGSQPDTYVDRKTQPDSRSSSQPNTQAEGQTDGDLDM